MRIAAFFIAFTIYAGVVFAQDSTPFVLGHINQIQSVQLGEKRVLNIYLPDGYSKDDTARYPVIYLLDGSADEDFVHIVGLVQFNSFPWVNRIPKSIVVGIANVSRMRDFTYPTTVDEDKKRYTASGHSDKFIAFIEKEVQPYIESEYKTNSCKTLIGESLGGLLAAQILLQKPTLFSKYIIISPSLWWDDASLLTQNSDLLNENFKAPLDVYIGVGKEGLGPTTKPHDMQTEANALSEKIKAAKSKTVKVTYDYLPDENHATISHMAVYNAFKLLYLSSDNK